MPWSARRRLVGVMLPAWLWCFLCWVCVQLLWLPGVACWTWTGTYQIYWNSSSPRFKSAHEDNVIEVNLYDSIDIICPQYSENKSSSEMEYYVVYMMNDTEFSEFSETFYSVNETSYNSCIMNVVEPKRKVLNCSNPRASRALYTTIFIVDFQPIPGRPDFNEGSKYYFISTSGGHDLEMNNQYHGSCYESRMRMVLSVVKPDNSKPATTQKPKTTPRHRTTTTTTTSTTTTTTTRRPITSRRPSTTTSKPFKPGFNGDNVIHVGEGVGSKNEGTITDGSGGRSSLRSPLSPLTLSLLSLLVLIALSPCLRYHR